MSLYGVHDYCLPAWVKEGSRLFLYHLLTFWVQRARVALRPTLINNLWPAVRPRDFTKFTEDDRLRVAEELFGSWGAVSSGTRLRYATSTDVTAPDCDVKTLTAELERYQWCVGGATASVCSASSGLTVPGAPSMRLRRLRNRTGWTRQAIRRPSGRNCPLGWTCSTR